MLAKVGKKGKFHPRLPTPSYRIEEDNLNIR